MKCLLRMILEPGFLFYNLASVASHSCTFCSLFSKAQLDRQLKYKKAGQGNNSGACLVRCICTCLPSGRFNTKYIITQ
jgi:hypothetical protein